MYWIYRKFGIDCYIIYKFKNEKNYSGDIFDIFDMKNKFIVGKNQLKQILLYSNK